MDSKQGDALFLTPDLDNNGDSETAWERGGKIEKSFVKTAS
jgi:hypothetical protein